MKTPSHPVLMTAALLLSLVAARADTPADASRIERGRYLVTGIGLCGDCHTPMTDKGPDMTLWLMGAPIPFKPLIEIPWSPAAPPIAGLPSMNHDQAVRFLMTGQRPDGSTPRPPMPSYRMNRDDAEAVAAYLKSVGPAGGKVAAN